MNDLFDRRIDLYFYSKDYKEIASILTPSIGPKPEIKVEGVIISGTYSISTKITVTNLERSVPIEEVEYIYAELYYGGATSSVIKKGSLYTVQYADQSKQPPDRQVCFNCIVSGISPEILSQPCSIGSIDSSGLVAESTVDKVASSFINQYNYAVTKNVTNEFLRKRLLLSKDPVYKMPESLIPEFKEKPIVAYSRSSSFADVLDSLSIASVERNVTKKGVTRFYALQFYIEEQHLAIAMNPNDKSRDAFALSVVPDDIKNKVPVAQQSRFLDLTYVITAYRCGTIVHCTTLFDPRIQQNTLIRIKRNAVVGKRASGKLIPVTQETIEFRAIGSIPFVFSTTTENYMRMQGVIEKLTVVKGELGE